MPGYFDKLQHRMCYCMTVGDLCSILEDMDDDGYGDALIAFRIGHHVETERMICFPVADIRISTNDKKYVYLTPAPRVGVSKNNGQFCPEFDCTVDENEDSISVRLEDLSDTLFTGEENEKDKENVQ